MTTGEAMKPADLMANERTDADSGQGESSCGAGDSDLRTAKVTVHKLSAECPTHGTVPVVCPRCAGTAGGMAHRGTRSRRKKDLKALADARRVLDIYPEAQMLQHMATERREFQDVADKMGLTKDERELAFTRMHLNRGMNYAKHICDRMGMSAEERARPREDMQKTVALALSSPDEVPAILEQYRRKE